jgi:hypothetical protein
VIDVEPDGRVGPPLQRARRDVEKAIRIGQGATQGVEQVAEIRARLRLGRIGPEQKGETLARLRRVPMEEEVGEQRFGARRLEGRQRPIALPQVEGAEEPNPERWRPHGDAPRRSPRVERP